MTNPAREDLGSNCCSATVIDPGGTGEGICSECKEHCTNRYIQEVDVAVLDFVNCDVHIIRLEYDSLLFEDMESFIDDYLTFKFGSTSDLEYMYTDSKPIKVRDDRDEVEKK